MTLKMNGSIKVMANELVGWQKKKMVGAVHLTVSAAVVPCTLVIHTQQLYISQRGKASEKKFQNNKVRARWKKEIKRKYKLIKYFI